MKKTKGRATRWRWICSAAAFLTATAIILGAGAFLQSRFQRSLPSDFFRLSMNGRSPEFYYYRFEDRVNRIGKEEALPAGMYAQRQTSYVTIQEIPDALRDAFVAIEDKRFYRHHGVDWYRTVAAGFNYVLGFSDSFGASTITQQLIKNVTGNSEVTLSRKLQEILYALDLERTLDKSQILEWYLNVIHFSDHCDGVADAARHYFSKTPAQLTVAECASLAAITNSPSYYHPIRHPENNLARRDLILTAMYEQEYLTEQEYRQALSEPLVIRETDPEQGEGINSWYTDMVIEDVIEDLMREYGMARAAASRLVYTGGLRIDTAMDPKIQQSVEEYYRTQVRMPADEEGTRAQSACIVIDSRTGDILGVAGAVGEKSGNRLQNFATQTRRPPGSVIKPITVYAPALEQGIINWASVYDDVPLQFGTNGRSPWPRNATGIYRGLTTVAYAVAHSTNTVSVRILEQVGLQNAFEMARERFHLYSLLSDERGNDCDLAALALGQLNYGVTLREITNAYTVFADGGMYHPCRSYFRVLDGEGRVLLSNADRGEAVLSVENAALMTKLMQEVVKDGTASSVKLKRQVECAGKTGTTNDAADRWFIGYTPELICGVWCGYEYPKPVEEKQICTRIWNDVMEAAFRERGSKTAFDTPASLIRATYCRDSGKLMTEACQLDPRGSRASVGWFVQGSQPQEPCDCHVLCDYDGEHGGICHGFCPEECIRKVALLRIERRFPMQVLVTDAQYVYYGDPLAVPPNKDPSKPYAPSEGGKYRGVSPTSHPLHRSCTEHIPFADIPFTLPFWEAPRRRES